MIFRTGDRRASKTAAADEVLAACERTFGRLPDEHRGNEVVLDELTFLYLPEDGQPPFVLRPECDRCGTQELEQFPLEEWSYDGAAVRAQARTTCRDCRFVLLGISPNASIVP